MAPSPLTGSMLSSLLQSITWPAEPLPDIYPLKDSINMRCSSLTRSREGIRGRTYMKCTTYAPIAPGRVPAGHHGDTSTPAIATLVSSKSIRCSEGGGGWTLQVDWKMLFTDSCLPLADITYAVLTLGNESALLSSLAGSGFGEKRNVQGRGRMRRNSKHIGTLLQAQPFS